MARSSLRTGALHRARLEALCEPLAPISVAQGAPGFGKSTFVSHWAARLAAEGHLVLRVDRHHPLGAVPVIAQELNAVEPPEKPAEQAVDLPQLAARIRAVGRPVVLVLDRAEQPESAFLEDLVRLLARCPNLHIIATARAGHPLGGLTSDAALDQRFVTATDLAFTTDEVVELAERFGITARREDLEALRTALGGWPALVVRALSDSAATWPVVDWTGVRQFIEEIDEADPLGESGRADLVTLALAGPVASEQWMHEQATHPPGTAGPFGRLRLLEIVGLAVKHYSAESGEPLWTMPSGVRDAVVELFSRKRPDHIMLAHARLARSFVAAGLVGRGLHHAVAARDVALVETIWTTHGLAALTGPTDTLQQHLPDLAEDLEKSSIVLVHARALIEAAAHADPRTTRRAVIEAERRLAEALDEGRIARRHPSGSALVARHVGQQAALRGARPHQSVELEPSRLPLEPVSSYFECWIQASSVLALFLSGDHDETLRAIRAVSPMLSGPGEGDSRAALIALRALILIREGRLEDGARELARSRGLDRDTAGVTMLRGLQAVTGAHLAIARLDLAALDAELATAHEHAAEEDMFWPMHLEALALREALRGHPAHGLSLLRSAAHSGRRSPVARRLLRRCAVGLLTMMGEVNRAQAMLDEEDVGHSHHTAQARIHLVAAETEAASVLASRVAWTAMTNRAEQTALLTVQAAAAAASGSEEVASRTWAQVGELANREGALLAYALLPAPLRDLAVETPGVLPDAAARDRVTQVGVDVPYGATLVRLTHRERIVLQMLATHDTMSKVAAELTVSVNTVKKQTLRIYSKLGVNERAAALDRAQSLGLI